MTLRRSAIAGGLAVLMALFGLGVYRVLGHYSTIHSGAATAPAADPVQHKAALSVPGSLYVAQGGDIFVLRGVDFTRVLAHDARVSWTQPSVLPDRRMLVVGRGAAFAELDLLDPATGGVTPLVSTSAPTAQDGSLADNHWIFDPVLGPDRTTVWFDYDEPKNGYLVDLAVWTAPLAALQSAAPQRGSGSPLPSSARQYTTPNDYTGGDVDPLPLAGGGVIFTRYSIDPEDKVHSQLWWAPAVQAAGSALTDPGEDCAQPALSPDGNALAMVCTNGEQLARLAVATFTQPAAASGARAPAAAPTVGPRRVVVDGTLVAQPVWAPDGASLVYLAPSASGGQFQLWWLRSPLAPAPAAPMQLTDRLGFDATSRPIWLGG